VTDAAGDSTTGGFTADLYRQNQGEAPTLIQTITEYVTSTGGIIKLFPDNQLETFDIKISKDATQTSALRLHYLGLDVTPGGQDIN